MENEMNEVGIAESFVAAGNHEDLDAELQTQSASKRSKNDADSAITDKTNGVNGAAEEGDLKEWIVSAWKDVQNNEIDLDKAFTATMTILGKQVESLIRSGLDAFHRAENATADCKLLQDEIMQKDMEIDRLRLAEEKNSTSLAVSHVECRRRAALTELRLLRLTTAQRKIRNDSAS